MHASLLSMTRTATVPHISLAILCCLHTKCQGLVIALKATWIKKWRLSLWFLRKSSLLHLCSFRHTEFSEIGESKKCKRVKNSWGKLQKMVAWRWTKSKREQVFIGPIHREEGVTEFRGQQKHWSFRRKSESSWQVDKSMKDSKAVCRVTELK